MACSLSIGLLLAAVCTLGSAEIEFCGLTGSAPDPFSDRIVGGVESIPHEFPWMVKLKKKGHFYCGAALIGDRYILTAAHCVALYKDGAPTDPVALRGNIQNYFMFRAEEIVAELGSHWSKEDQHPVIERPVEQVIIHPEYDVFISHGIMIQTNDIALLKISPIQFAYNIIPICLPNPGDKIRDGAIVVVAGWGSTNTETIYDKKTTLPDALMKTALHKIPWQKCRENPNMGAHLEPVNQMGEEEIFCLIGNNTDSCRGDSGGPAIVGSPQGFIVAGIVSWGLGCNQEGYPAAYTQVSSYMDFIHSHTADGVTLPRRPL